ncbi:MAG TPA: SIS domain-containing protein [Pilimelia sp.]|nr:SIS domain-containing protein [Pilimelia sp.]
MGALLPFRAAAAPLLARWGSDLAWTLGCGGRLLVAGNGGSAAEAQHLTAELVGKLRDDRQPLSAIALTAETSSLTAIGNDYGYEEVFARQVRAHGRADDVLVTLSTSGRSRNLLAAVEAAAEVGMRSWALTGPAPNPLAAASDQALAVPSDEPQVVQELHLLAVHIMCTHVDLALPAVSSVADSYGPAEPPRRSRAALPADADAGPPVRRTLDTDGRPYATAGGGAA